jgi:transcriptional regulator with XRE-family HTH domain
VHNDRTAPSRLTDADYADIKRRFAKVAKSLRLAVREGRAQLGFNQSDLARELAKAGLELDVSAINRIESGQRTIRADEAWAIAHVLQMELDDFFGIDSSVVSRDSRIASLRHAADALRGEIEELTTELATTEGLLEAYERIDGAEDAK